MRGDWVLISQGEHHQTWTATESTTDQRTGRTIQRKKHVVEIGSGQNYRDAEGRWQRTREEFQITPEGFAVAQFGPHQLIVGNNINSPNAVDILTFDGVRLQNGPLAVGFFDPNNGRNHILATIRDTPGVQTAPTK